MCVCVPFDAGWSAGEIQVLGFPFPSGGGKSGWVGDFHAVTSGIGARFGGSFLALIRSVHFVSRSA